METDMQTLAILCLKWENRLRSLEEGYSDNTGIFQNLAEARWKRKESSNKGNSLLKSMEI